MKLLKFFDTVQSNLFKLFVFFLNDFLLLALYVKLIGIVLLTTQERANEATIIILPVVFGELTVDDAAIAMNEAALTVHLARSPVAKVDVTELAPRLVFCPDVQTKPVLDSIHKVASILRTISVDLVAIA